MIGDVTPVGWPTGETRRKRGPLRILIGLALLVPGVVAVVIGISGAVSARSAIDDAAVARATLGRPATFRIEAPNRYTVYVLFGGDLFTDSDRQDVMISQTACETSTGDRFGGSSQGTSVKLGNAATVGRFDASAGEMSITCSGPTDDSYVVTLGGTGAVKSILAIVAGAFAAIGGLLLFIWGLIGRRAPA
jgi:hypothetical protein